MKIIKIGTFFLLNILIYSAHAQDTIKVMHYNLMYYGKYIESYGCTSTTNNIDTKNQYLKTIIKHVKPDIFSVNELDGQGEYPQSDDASYLLNNALNVDGVSYYRKTETPKIYLANIIFYNSNKLILKKSQALKYFLGSSEKSINVYQFYFNSLDLDVTHDTAYVYFAVAHLKAGSGVLEETQRAYETSIIMDYFENLGQKGNYVVMGDFNLYSPTESSFQNLINPNNSLYAFFDPADQIGEWSGNYDYRFIHTQSTHTSGECFSSGGMDDRFDFILASDDIMNGANHFQYINDSYKTIGQDGSRFNQAFNITTNTVVPSNVAQALYNMSDHLPVYIELKVDQDLGEPLGTQALINENLKIKVNNPVSEYLNISIDIKSSQDFKLDIFNIQGELKLEEEFKNVTGSFEKDISVAGFPNGLYVVKISDQGNLIYSTKIIIQN